MRRNILPLQRGSHSTIIVEFAEHASEPVFQRGEITADAVAGMAEDRYFAPQRQKALDKV
ncbi:MAG: hypothetical protein AUJ49_08805 [Desulfovibrionaceae bacterium CG1_02_65_16]|nr:MAG: hypothetical protein AUJ49_08805 [Desulfovibrionaceae bacterium CG1_02_65_16]